MSSMLSKALGRPSSVIIVATHGYTRLKAPLYSAGITVRFSHGVRLMTTQQELLFTDLNALTEDQIGRASRQECGGKTGRS